MDFELEGLPHKTVGLPLDVYGDPEQRDLVPDLFKHHMEDPGLPALVAADKLPVPDAAAREYYWGDRHLAYWLSGHDDYLRMQRFFQPTAGSRIMDFGGASGRVARHFVSRHPEADMTIVDININHVKFVNENFPENTRALKVATIPSIPLPDASMDFIYGISIFTHIDAYETGWLAELDRILAPNGVIWLTFHSENTWSDMVETPLFDHLKISPRFNEIWNDGGEMPDERLAFYYGSGHDYSCNIFHKSSYLRKVWGRFFDVEEILFREHVYHSVIVLKKKSGRV